MKTLLGKTIVAVDEKRDNFPFFRILLDDGSLLNISSGGNALELDYIADAEEAFELSGGMILDSHNELGQQHLRPKGAETPTNADAQVSAGPSCYASYAEFENIFRDAMETCPNLDEDWYTHFKWVARSLYLLLSNTTEEEVRAHTLAVECCPEIFLKYGKLASKDSQ